MNSKEKLIEMLRGSVDAWRSLPEAILKEDIYTETGHVDTDFLTAILSYMSEQAEVAVAVQKALNHLLGCDEPEMSKKTDDKTGAKWNVEQILQNCTLKDNVLYLPDVQLQKKSYLEAKKWIEEAGGSWNTSKQGFVFEFDATRVFSILHTGKRCNLQKDFQYFATPVDVADYAVSKFSRLTADMTILEPSAGRGALIRAVQRRSPHTFVHCYELMPENVEFLRKMANVLVEGADFMECTRKYDRIIANPPFAFNQDIKHVRKMYDLLENGGEMASIMSSHWRFAAEKVCSDFRDWLSEVGAEIDEIPANAFKESGTSVSTVLVFIRK